MTTVVTDIPSPYQVELFNEVARSVPLHVVYIRRDDPSRQWQGVDIAHDHSFLSDQALLVRRSRLLVVSQYSPPILRAWMRERETTGKPWAFWAERPGAKYRSLPGVLYRRLMLSTLRRSQAPIWGIGEWGCDGYRHEIGGVRSYFNVPYASDLARFRSPTPLHSRGQTLLFSGQICERKGADLLARAFSSIADEFPNARVEFAGSGPMTARLQSKLALYGDRVTFHGFVQWQDLPAIYARATFLCVPSRYDGWGLFVPEGLAAGLPVITTDQVGAARDLIEPGVNGWICGANDEASLSAALRQAFSTSGESLEKMRAAAVASSFAVDVRTGARRFIEAAEKSIEVFR